MFRKVFLSVLIGSMLGGAVQAQLKGDAAAGKAKYDMLCASCHGVTGKGDGAAAMALNPKPRNFQDAVYMSKKSDADLTKVIQKGGAAAGLSPTMPAWGSALKEQEIANVVAYIRTLGKGK